MGKYKWRKTTAFLMAVLILAGMTGCQPKEKGAGSDPSLSSTDGTVSTEETASTTGASDETTVTGDASQGADKSTTPGQKSTGTRSVTTQPIPTGKPVEETKKLTGKVELQIFSGGYGSQAWENALSGFQKANPELDVVAYLDSNVNRQMLTRWMKGNPPDFVFLDGNNIPKETWIAENKLMDLTSFYESATVYGSTVKIKDKIKEGLVVTYGGKVRELPLVMSTYGLWYDEKFMTDKKLSVPGNFDQLMSYGAACKAIGVPALCYPGVFSGYLVWGMVMPAVAAYGQEYFDKVSGATDPAAFTDARFKDVLTRFKQFADAGYILQGTVSLNHTQSQMQWLAHKAALIPNGLWLENEMKNDTPAGFRMRYLPSTLQQANQKPCIIATSSSFAVAEQAKNKEAALAFIRYLYRDDVVVDFATLTGVPTAAKADLSKTTLSETAKSVQRMMESNAVTMIHKSTTWGSVDSTMNDVINQIVLKRLSVDQACEKLAEATRRKLAE